jgi:hypothetical protein
MDLPQVCVLSIHHVLGREQETPCESCDCTLSLRRISAALVRVNLMETHNVTQTKGELAAGRRESSTG